MDWTRLGLGLGAAVAFGIGAWRIAAEDHPSLDGYALMTVALILVGVSLALEFHDRWHGD